MGYFDLTASQAPPHPQIWAILTSTPDRQPPLKFGHPLKIDSIDVSYDLEQKKYIPYKKPSAKKVTPLKHINIKSSQITKEAPLNFINIKRSQIMWLAPLLTLQALKEVR